MITSRLADDGEEEVGVADGEVVADEEAVVGLAVEGGVVVVLDGEGVARAVGEVDEVVELEAAAFLPNEKERRHSRALVTAVSSTSLSTSSLRRLSSRNSTTRSRCNSHTSSRHESRIRRRRSSSRSRRNGRAENEVRCSKFGCGRRRRSLGRWRRSSWGDGRRGSGGQGSGGW